MTEPFFSIVIPVLNRRILFEETLACLRGQSFHDWECLVIDDGSTDGTREMVEAIAREDQRIRLLAKPPEARRGPSASRNIGLRAAKGRFVHFFDSDDLLADDFYEFCHRRVETGGNEFFAVGIRWFVEPSGNGLDWDLSEAKPFHREEFAARAVASVHNIWTQNVVWRRDLLLSLESGYREDLSQVEDLEFSVRAILSARSFDFDDSPRVYIRRHSESLTFSRDPARDLARRLSNDDVFRLILRHLEKAGQDPAFVTDYCLTERYRHLTWAIRLGSFHRSLPMRHARLLMDLSIRRPRLAMRLAILGPAFWVMGIRARTTRAGIVR